MKPRLKNEEQEIAIHHGDGPMMVLAGPGAGKTYVITNRVIQLITEHEVSPEEILVVTFSRAAAEEMKERFDRMTERRYPMTRFGTFHSVFFQILKNAYHYEAGDIVGEALKYRLIGEALADTRFEVEDKQEFLEALDKEISLVKGEGIDVENYYSANCPEQVFRDIFTGYQERLQRHRALDFDDMVSYTYQLFDKRKDILAKWQAHFQYILIDEFQDINRLQYETIRMLAEPENNLFIVGDDDQSIYGFRGARPDIMLSFPKQYPEAETVTLGVNYRCSPEIIESAGKLIGHNKKRYGKKIAAEKESEEPVHITVFPDLSSEAEQICHEIQTYRESGYYPEQMAVLFRTNLLMRTLSGKLMEYGIPFSMKEGLPDIFQSWLAKDVIAYIRMSMGEMDRELFLQVMNRPVRYISRKALEKETIDFRDIRQYYMREKQYWMIDRLSDMEMDIRSIRKMTPLSAIHYIRQQIGYDDYLKERAAERGISPDDWLETMEEIEDSAGGMKTHGEWLAFIEEYGKELKRLREESRERKPEGVSLMTMHGAKGLEFDIVFIPTVNEEVCPYRKAVQGAEIEEERRMLYVAMTRAKHHLHMSCVRRRFNKKAEPSRFLQEINNKGGE